METSKKQGPKVPAKSNLECWQNCFVSFAGLSLAVSFAFCGFHWFSLVFLNSCSFAVLFHCFFHWFSLVFLFFFFGFHVFSLVFSRFWRHSKFKIKICKTGQHYKFQCVAT